MNKFIKIAELANELDSINKIEEANQVDNILAELIKFNKKASKLHSSNIETYFLNNVNFSNLSYSFEKALKEINSESSLKLANDIKIAGNFGRGLIELVKSPFSSVSNFFRDLGAGGKFKKLLYNSLDNLHIIRESISNKDFNNAKNLMLRDIDSMLSLLKESFGDLEFFDDTTKQEQDLPKSQDDKLETSPEQPKSARSIGKLIKESQNRGALALINDLAQLKYAITNSNENNLEMAFNAWAKVLSTIANVQYDKKPEPIYYSRNPDINDPSRGGGFSPHNPMGGISRINVINIPKTKVEYNALKALANATSWDKAKRRLLHMFDDRGFSDEQAGQIVEDLRMLHNPNKYWEDNPYQISPNRRQGYYGV